MNSLVAHNLNPVSGISLYGIHATNGFQLMPCDVSVHYLPLGVISEEYLNSFNNGINKSRFSIVQKNTISMSSATEQKSTSIWDQANKLSGKNGHSKVLERTVLHLRKKYPGRMKLIRSLVRKKHELPESVWLSRKDALAVVLSEEYPQIPIDFVLRKLTPDQIGNIIERKYLFAWQETPEALVRTVRAIMSGKDGSKALDLIDPLEELGLPDGTKITKEQIISKARLYFKLEKISDSLVLDSLKEKAQIVLKADEESLRRLLFYIFRERGEKIPAPYDFVTKQYRKPDGEWVSGRQIKTAIISVERGKIDSTNRFSQLSNSEIIRLIREKYLFRFDGTKESLVLTFRNILNDNPSWHNVEDLMNDGFMGKVFLLPDRTRIKGSDMAEVGRKTFSLHYADDKQVLKALWEMNLTVLYNDAQSVGRVFRHLVSEYDFKAEDVNKTSFLNRTFAMPDGSTAKGNQIVTTLAGLEHPSVRLRQALRRMLPSEIETVVREKYLYQWNKTQRSLILGLRFALENKGQRKKHEAGNHPHAYLFPDGTIFSESEIISLGKDLFGWNDVDEQIVLKRLIFRAKVALKNDSRSLHGVIHHILESGQLDVRSVSGDHSFRQAIFDLPDGSKVRGIELLVAIACLNFPNAKPTAAMKKMGFGMAALSLKNRAIRCSHNYCSMGKVLPISIPSREFD